MIKKNHDRIPPQIYETWGLSLFLCSPSPRKLQAIMGGANLAARLIGVLSKHDTSPGEVKFAPDEEEDDDKEDKEGMECG